MTHPDEELHGRGVDRRLMRRLFAYLVPYRGQVALALLLALLDALVQLAGPLLTKEAIDHGIRHRDLAHLDRVALLYLSALGLGFLLNYWLTQLMQRVGQNIMLDLRLALFRHLQRLPVAYFDRQPVGRIMTRVTHDVDVLNELFTSGVVSIVGDLLVLTGIVIAMVQLNAELMGVTFSVLPLIVIVTLVFRVRVRRAFRDIRVRLARMNGFLNENLGGMSTIQLLGRERRNLDQFREVNAAHREANLAAVRAHALFFPLLELIAAIAVALIIWYGGRQVMWSGITLGILVAFIQYTQRFFRPIADLSEKYGILQQAMASSERIFELLDTPADPDLVRAEAARAGAPAVAGPVHGPAGTVREPARVHGTIEFDHVWFAYTGEDWVLRDVSFRIAPGEKVAMVGATGSGKTTAASLLVGFHAPQRGAIRVDGRDLREWDLRALRRRVGLVLQDVFLFSGTIADNLALGQPDAAPDLLERAAREVQVHEFIAALPGGYGHAVRERGAAFSAGQRQLLAFARALVVDPDVLVLDEATAHVDTHTEAQLQEALRRLLRGRTCLVIAHRLSTIQDASRIVVLHHGEVRETGTHAELVARGGLYHRLVQLQDFGAGRKRSEPDAWTGLDESGFPAQIDPA